MIIIKHIDDNHQLTRGSRMVSRKKIKAKKIKLKIINKVRREQNE